MDTQSPEYGTQDTTPASSTSDLVTPPEQSNQPAPSQYGMGAPVPQYPPSYPPLSGALSPYNTPMPANPRQSPPIPMLVLMRAMPHNPESQGRRRCMGSLLTQTDFKAAYSLLASEAQNGWQYANFARFFTLNPGDRYAGCDFILKSYKVTDPSATLDGYVNFLHQGQTFSVKTTFSFFREGDTWKVYDVQIK